MTASGPQVQTPSSPQKSTVTILTVTQVYRRSSEPTRTLTLVFASRELARFIDIELP